MTGSFCACHEADPCPSARPGYVRAGAYWVPVEPLHFPADDSIRRTTPADDAYNAVAAASVGYEQARNTLRSACWSALPHGLTVDDLARAAGRDTDYIHELIREGYL